MDDNSMMPFGRYKRRHLSDLRLLKHHSILLQRHYKWNLELYMKVIKASQLI